MVANQNIEVKRDFQLEGQYKAGANCFYWIAGLSVVNSIVIIWGGDYTLFVGLAINQVIAGIGAVVAEDLGSLISIITFMFCLIPAGIFFLFGVLANKKYKSFFIIGMIVYIFDILLYGIYSDLLSIGFHLYILIYMGKGLIALFQLSKMGKERISNKSTSVTKPYFL